MSCGGNFSEAYGILHFTKKLQTQTITTCSANCHYFEENSLKEPFKNQDKTEIIRPRIILIIIFLK